MTFRYSFDWRSAARRIRFFPLLLLAVVPLGAAPARVEAQQRAAARPDAVDRQIARFANFRNEVVRRNPSLPGLEEARAEDRLFARFSEEDRALLTSVFYVDARAAAARLRRPLTEAAVRRALTTQPATSTLSLDRALIVARERAAADPRYRRELARIVPGWLRCVDADTGSPIFSTGLCLRLIHRGLLSVVH